MIHQNSNPTNYRIKNLFVKKVFSIKLVNFDESYINLWQDKHTRSERTWLRCQETGTSLPVRWLRLWAFTALDMGLIPGQGTKTPTSHEARPKKKENKQKRYQGTKVSSWWQFLHFSSLRTHISFSLLLELGTPWGAEWHRTGGSGIMPQGPGDRLWGQSPKWDCSFLRLSALDPVVMRKLEARGLLWPQHLFHPTWVLAGRTLPTREDKGSSPKPASSGATDQWSSLQWRTGWPLPAISSLSLRLWLFGPGERRSQLQHARSQGSVEAGHSPFHLQESWAAIYFAFNSSWA